MARGKRGGSGRLDPEDLLAGRAHAGLRELIALIHEVNPSGLGLSARQTERRYALKSRLQSLLVRLYEDEIDVRTEPGDGRVVSLRHRLTGTDACHAILDLLDEDARSRVQRQVDLEAGANGAEDPPDEPPSPPPLLIPTPPVPLRARKRRAPRPRKLTAPRRPR